MGNLFLGFPVPRAKIADMISTSAPPALHHTQHEAGGSDQMNVTGLTGAGGGGVGIFDFFTYSSTGEAIQGWVTDVLGSGYFGGDYPGIYCGSGATAGSYAKIWKGAGWPSPMLTFSKDRILVANATFLSNGSATGTFYLTSGDTGSQKHIGFKIVDGVLKGSVGNGSAETTVDLETLSATNYNKTRDLRAVFTSGVKCEFYSDGVLLGTITTGLPTGTDTTPTLFVLYAENPGVAQNKEVNLTFYHIAIKL